MVIFASQNTKDLIILYVSLHRFSTIACTFLKRKMLILVSGADGPGKESLMTGCSSSLGMPHVIHTINSIFDGRKTFLCQQ